MDEDNTDSIYAHPRSVAVPVHPKRANELNYGSIALKPLHDKPTTTENVPKPEITVSASHLVTNTDPVTLEPKPRSTSGPFPKPRAIPSANLIKPDITSSLTTTHVSTSTLYDTNTPSGTLNSRAPIYPEKPGYKPPIDVNSMKRNMSIAKGFLDVSLMTANANQLRHLLTNGDSNSYVYYVVLVGLILSLILQVCTGIMLIMKERFDLNVENDHKSLELYNNITILFILLTLLLNVFITSFGVKVMKPPQNSWGGKTGSPNNFFDTDPTGMVVG